MCTAHHSTAHSTQHSTQHTAHSTQHTAHSTAQQNQLAETKRQQQQQHYSSRHKQFIKNCIFVPKNSATVSSHEVFYLFFSQNGNFSGWRLSAYRLSSCSWFKCHCTTRHDNVLPTTGMPRLVQCMSSKLCKTTN